MDYFIWSALDDRTFEPEESRPFGDDERHYNSVLNAYFFRREVRAGELTSSAARTQMRLPSLTKYAPYYFPDGANALVVVKDWNLWDHIEYRIKRLRATAELGQSLTPGMELPADSFVVREEAYMGYYKSLQRAGRRFADASPKEREAACVLSMKAALNRADQLQDDAGGVTAYVVSRHITHELIPDFEEPEAYCP